jgi:tetratricopeptide (TPR) repeat protein
MRARRGELRRAGDLWREARQAALDFGNPTIAHFVRSNIALADYAAGRWDEALRAAEEMIAEFEAGRASSQGQLSRTIRSWIYLARADVGAAIEDARVALATARRAGSPQDLVPALATTAALMLELGRRDEADHALDDAVAVVSPVRGRAAPEFGVALALAERWSDLRAHVESMPASRWRDMHRALLACDIRRAALVADEAGSLPVAARLRLLAANRLLETGDHETARSELAGAVDFWQSVGARYWLGYAAGLQQRIAAASPSGATRATR